LIRTDRKTDCQILDRLEKRYSAPHWIFLRELRNDTGFQSTRACDALALGLYHSRGQLLVGFEKKISRADWLRELREPDKAEAVAQFCDQWYVVVPDKEIANIDELPSTWGLMLVAGNKITVLRTAPSLTPRPIDRGLLAALVERSIEQAVKPYQITKAEAKEQELSAAFDRGKNSAARELESAERLRENVKAFEDASGIKIDSYYGGRDLGERVRAAQNKDRFARDAERAVSSAVYELKNRTLPAMEEFLERSRTQTESRAGTQSALASGDELENIKDFGMRG
jgi:hypothetical protein